MDTVKMACERELVAFIEVAPVTRSLAPRCRQPSNSAVLPTTVSCSPATYTRPFASSRTGSPPEAGGAEPSGASKSRISSR